MYCCPTTYMTQGYGPGYGGCYNGINWIAIIIVLVVLVLLFKCFFYK